MGTRGSSSSTRRLPFGCFCKHGHQFGTCSIHSGLPNWWDRLWRRCNRVCGLLAADGPWSGSLTGNEVKLRHLSTSTLIGRLFDAPETVYHGALGSAIISSALLSLTTLMQVVPQVESGSARPGWFRFPATLRMNRALSPDAVLVGVRLTDVPHFAQR